MICDQLGNRTQSGGISNHVMLGGSFLKDEGNIEHWTIKNTFWGKQSNTSRSFCFQILKQHTPSDKIISYYLQKHKLGQLVNLEIVLVNP